MNRRQKYFLSVLSLYFVYVSPVAAQFSWPLDSPLVITGNYGELRPNHFHAGIDFSTSGKINKRVYAIDNGYVSRIRVSSGGYGKCVYVTHPGGKVSVYAHLNSFAFKIAEAVKKEQYAVKKYEVELLPAPGAIKISKGEVIGLSGNTGGSSGPHLHFEVRDERSETPLDPFSFFRIRDSLPPSVESIGIYDLRDTCSPKFIKSVEVKGNSDSAYTVPAVIGIEGSVAGIAFSGADRIFPKGNPNNIHAAALYLDNRLIYSHELSTIDFADNRFVNEFSETQNGLKYQKCFMPSVYPARFYSYGLNKGRIILPDTAVHQIRLVLLDENKNRAAVSFSMRSVSPGGYLAPSLTGGHFINCHKDAFIRSGDLSLFIPARTLYNCTPLLLERAGTDEKQVRIQPAVNLAAGAILGVPVPSALREKPASVVLRSGGAVYLPQLKNDTLYFAIKSFGEFTLATDNEGPRCKTLLSAKKIRRIKHKDSFTFLISDNLSGISTYDLYVNNVWMLAEYDAKSDRLTCYFTDASPAGTVKLRLELRDRLGNFSKFDYTIRR